MAMKRGHSPPALDAPAAKRHCQHDKIASTLDRYYSVLELPKGQDPNRFRQMILSIVFKMMDCDIVKGGSFSDIFNCIDSDSSGKINAVELHNGLRKLGIDISYEEVHELGTAMDEDHDGELSTVEFANLLFRMNDYLQQEFHNRVMRVDGAWLFSVRQVVKLPKEPLMPGHGAYQLLRDIIFAILAKGINVGQLFGSLDQNGDMQISLVELVNGLQSQLGLKVDVEAIVKVLIIFDIDSSGALDIFEFIAMLKYMNEILQDRFRWHYHCTKDPETHLMHQIIFKVMACGVSLVGLFDSFDKDKNGLLSCDELVLALLTLGVNATVPQVQSLIRHFSQRTGDNIDLKDFVRMVQQTNQEMQNRFKKNVLGTAHTEVAAARAPVRSFLRENKSREWELMLHIVSKAMQVDKNLAAIFHAMDKAGDGKLTACALADGLVSFGIAVHPDEVLALFQMVDRDANQAIDVREFFTMIEDFNHFIQDRFKWCLMSLEQRRDYIILQLIRKIKEVGGAFHLVDLFRAIDIDHSKGISIAEFAQGLFHLKINITAGELRTLFEAFDEDRNEQMQLEEFCVMLKEAAALAPQITKRLKEDGMDL